MLIISGILPTSWSRFRGWRFIFRTFIFILVLWCTTLNLIPVFVIWFKGIDCKLIRIKSFSLICKINLDDPGKNTRWDPANPAWDPRCVPGGIPPFSGGIPPGIMEHPTWDPANWSCFSKPWFKFLRRRREVVKMATEQRRGKELFLKRAHLLVK